MSVTEHLPGGLASIVRAFGSIEAATAKLASLTHCGCCEQLLYDEAASGRSYSLRGGVTVLAVLCRDCDAMIAPNSDADSQFQQRLSAQANEIAAAGHGYKFVRATTTGRAFHILIGDQ